MLKLKMGVAATLLALLAGCGSNATQLPTNPEDGGEGCFAVGFHACEVDGGLVCTNTRMDPNNCGACGNVCPSTLSDGGTGNFTATCAEVMGVPTCGIVCEPGYTACSQVELQTCTYDFSSGDPEAIPITDVSAASNLFITCEAVCVDVANDPNNCGQCGTSCTATCSSGTCQ